MTGFPDCFTKLRPEWLLDLNTPCLKFVQFSVLKLLQCGDPTALSGGRGTQHCGVISSLQINFSSLSSDDFPIPTYPDLIWLSHQVPHLPSSHNNGDEPSALLLVSSAGIRKTEHVFDELAQSQGGKTVPRSFGIIKYSSTTLETKHPHYLFGRMRTEARGPSSN